MVRVTRKKKKKARRLYGLFFLIFLSAAAGVGLYKLSPSLLDIGRIFRHAADNFLEQSADTMSAEPVLRGTVFDLNFEEIAVSYKLYSLYVRPSEIVDIQDVVRVVADVTGQDEETLYSSLNGAKSIVNIAEHLEQPQVDLIKNARLQGLYIKPVEERFYPKHETAASLVGFTGKGIGLTGIEGVFEMLLQDGEFRTDSISEIDFSEEQVLGRSKVDVVLTIDMALQKRVEDQLKLYLDRSHATRGIALLMDPKSGAVLAWVSLPSFNPNYYWQVPELHVNTLFKERMDPDLLRNFRFRVAAILKNGETGDFPVPEMVASSDYGLKKGEIGNFDKVLGNNFVNDCFLPSCNTVLQAKERVSGANDDIGYTAVELTASAASLINGGWKVSPYILNAVFDHNRNQVYGRSSKKSVRERVLSPSMGVRIRHDLVTRSAASHKANIIILADAVQRIRNENGKGKYVMQEALLGAIPAKSPEALLFIFTQRDELYPSMPEISMNKKSLNDFGEDLLKTVYSIDKKKGASPQYIASAVPKEPDRANYNQFLISSRIDFQERGVNKIGRVAVMPQLVGLSLRKGLQRLNEHDLQVKVQGSGQIVSQVPSPGEPLQGIGECVLTLDSEI